jgi:hypothetical protein
MRVRRSAPDTLVFEVGKEPSRVVVVCVTRVWGNIEYQYVIQTLVVSLLFLTCILAVGISYRVHMEVMHWTGTYEINN